MYPKEADDPFAGLEDLDSFRRSGRPQRDNGEGDAEVDNRPAKAARPTFPCMSCAGTGRYRGVRIHQEKEQCFACGGRGFFLKSDRDRSAARAKSAARKQRAQDEAKAAFDEAHPGVREFLAGATWSAFLTELLAKLNQYGDLSERQLAAVRASQAKQAERDAAYAAKKAESVAARTTALDLQPIHAMFDKARDAGLNKLQYRAEGLVLSLAKATSANPGAIYVKTKDGEYLGKVVNKGFVATRGATDEHKAALNTIAANPAEAAARYGKKTGECSCCGRELSDPVSVAAGIGPICATKWF